MKKFFVLTIFLTQLAFGQWFWQNPLPQNNNLKAVKYITSTFVLAVGDNGAVMKSTDGGSTWTKLLAPKNPGVVGETTNPLSSISFINENTGWIVGDYSIFKTIDGGNTWQLQSLGINRDMNAIFFVDENIGYVGGNNGELYKTTNGGANWTKQDLGTGVGTISSIYFINATTGWIAGDLLIARTTDGSTWISAGSITGKHYNIHFIDANNGFSIGQYGTFFKSTNGGETWTKKTFPSTSVSLYGAFFKDVNTGIVVCGQWNPNGSNKGYIYRTTNGGTSWTEISAGLFEQLNGVAFIDANTGIAVGDVGRIMKTTNGGLNWSSISSGFTSYINSSHFIDSNTGYIVGGVGDYDGVVYKTTDGGTTWLKKQSGEMPSVKSVYFIDANTGWIGVQNKIYKTTNGGDSWTQQSSSYTSRALTFLDANVGISANANSISRTIDGGTTWSKVADYDCNSVFFISSLVGYCTGFNSATYKTTDGGATWALLTGSPKGNYVFFVNNDVGFVAGSGMWKTTNGGTSWVKQTIEVVVLSVFFFDTNKGIAVGTEGQVWNTTNGGTNWARTWPTVMCDLNKVHFVSPTTGWIVGQYGTILKSTSGGATWIKQEESVPEQYVLYQNYPNPFNPSTVISWQLEVGGQVTLKVYDVLGNEVATLVNEIQSAGIHRVEFQSAVGSRQLASGIYFYQLRSSYGGGNFVQTKKFILLK
ncbi:MAG: YCF48-related protein [Ignavibacteria bacterium]|nr:YCF48-related protein [Ignavibacteria bacterium]